jgi:transposase-like protein
MKQRRQFTPEFKAKIVLDILTCEQTLAEVCRKHRSG